MATVIRWLALPLAAFCALAPLSAAWEERQVEAKLVPTAAIVLEAHVVNASRVDSEWDLWVRYPVRGRNVEGPLRAWSTFGIAKDDTRSVLVDPASRRAQDEQGAQAWIVIGCGALSAAFFVGVGFFGMGAMLQRDRRARGIGMR